MTIHCSGQSSDFLSKYKFKDIDSWVYLDETKSTRYDLPKLRVQRLERLARQAFSINNLYLESQELIEQMSISNLKLQDELIKQQPELRSLQGRVTELGASYKVTLEENSALKQDNLKLNNTLDKTKEKLSKSKKQRNLAILTTLVATAVIVLK